MWKKGNLIFDKRGEDIFPNVIFIVVNILFFSMLILFVFKASSGAFIYEQAYAKQVAMLIDYSTPKTDIKIDFSKAINVAKENKKTENLVKINDVNKEVIVSLSNQGGYAMKYFSDYDVIPEIKNGFLFLSIKARGGAPEKLEDVWPEIKKEVPVIKFGESIFKIRTFTDMKKAMEYSKTNSVVDRNCLCGDNCEEYAQYLVDASSENGIPDSLILLSLMMQESSCNSQDDSGSSIGLMQVNLDNCGKYGLDSNKDDCKNVLLKNPQANINAGVLELLDKYNFFDQDSCDSVSDCKVHPANDGGSKYCNGQSCEIICSNSKCAYKFDGCSERNAYYSGWEAALRFYNGWGCNPSYPAQDKFVEEIMSRYEILRGVVEHA